MLGNLLVRFIITEKLQGGVEEELRLLIHHLNALVLNEKSKNHQYLRVILKYSILKSKKYIS